MSVSFASFEQIQVGDEVVLRKAFVEADIEAFAALSGDHNPLHLDDTFATRARFPGRVVHGMLSAAQVSAMIGMRLPGPGALWTEQHFNFLGPVFVGDEVTFVLRVKQKSEGSRTLVVELAAHNQRVEAVLSGEGSDELFLGYQHLSQEPFVAFYARWMNRSRRLVRRIPFFGKFLSPPPDRAPELIQGDIDRPFHMALLEFSGGADVQDDCPLAQEVQDLLLVSAAKKFFQECKHGITH